MATKYVDDKIEYIESDTEKIARKPLMYISYAGSKGALHLAKEVINNAIDEAISKRSPADTVDILFEEKDNRLTISDNGRGIPFDSVEIACTKIQAGSKFDRDTDKQGVNNKSYTAGENGVGLTAVNALSDVMIFIIYREGKKGTFIFKNGKLFKKEIVKAGKHDKKNGTTVSFVPSEKYLGKCKINYEDLKEWVTYISYLIDSNIKMSLHYAKSGNDTIKTIDFHHENGLKDMLLDWKEVKPLFDPVYVNFSGSYKVEENGDISFDTNREKSLGNDIVIQAALTIVPTVHNDEDTHYKSFCNYINTVDHGVHVNAVKTAWCQLMTKLSNEALTEAEAKKLQINFDDCRNGLYGTINILCDNPQFASQTKEKISNDELFKPIRKIVYHYLFNYFKANPIILKKVLKFIKTNAKSRLEIDKVRKSEYSPMDNLSEHTLGCFCPANDDGYKEIFIVEGRSAKGSLRNARDARTQALFALRGVPKNSFGIKLSELLANQEFKYLVKCLGCGIGANFNMSKLKYNKIIIFTDSDIDGFRIASLISTFFITQYPEIVKAGLLYKAVAPLYLIDDPKHPYILNKIEYYRYFADKLVKIMTVTKGKKQLSNSELKNLIIENNQYLSYLNALINYYSINSDIIEFIVEYKDEDISDKAFNKLLKKRFPEMVYEDNTVKGVYEGSYQYITIDKTFYTRSKELKKLILNMGINDFSFTDGKVEMNHVTFGKFLRYANKYMPVTKSRLKGLGEMNGKDLWQSSLNPATRELIQLTTDDIEKDLERFQALHGKRDSDARKELMKEYILDINDIDN